LSIESRGYRHHFLSSH